jgi:hypothetical protein
MASFLDRYCRGEHEQVWRDMVALGPAVRAPDIFADAWAVVSETMRRARENVDRLIVRLPKVGYDFAYKGPPAERSFWHGDSYPIHAPPTDRDDVTELLDEFEVRVGPMPLSLRAWYEQVGSVNSIGTHADWPDTEEIDPLVVGPLAEVLESAEEEYWDRQDELSSDPEAAAAFGIDIAPDRYHKADISGGPAYAVAFPSSTADAALLNEYHATTFVNYLRLVFRWGGFPRFDRMDAVNRPESDLAFLTRDLLPL